MAPESPIGPGNLPGSAMCTKPPAELGIHRPRPGQAKQFTANTVATLVHLEKNACLTVLMASNDNSDGI
ncbi:hypothetical protein TYRP_007583 [Tyrophagus putrescentiae]|nr:hypothetical protein TYRP_007583 [Tyrophagus putrescentiae]